MSIEEQILIADKVLDSLYTIDPFAIVAGGAPRDWYFGKEASDVDVFFHDTSGLTIMENKLRRLGYNVSGNNGEHLPEHYKLNPNLAAVFSTTVEGQSVQFLMMHRPTFKTVIDQFPLSICKAWYKNSRVKFDRDFLRSVKHEAIVKTNTIYADENKYLQKIIAKFPDFNYYQSWDDLAKDLLDKE